MVIRRSGFPLSASCADSRISNGFVAFDVGHAVRHQDDVVVGVRTLSSGLVRKPDPQVQSGLHVGPAVRGEPVDRALDRRVVRVTVFDRVLADHVVRENGRRRCGPENRGSA